DPRNYGSSPSQMHQIGANQWLFFADSANSIRSLWTTNGTTAGTSVLNSGSGATTDNGFVINGILYWSNASSQLWRSDGTAAGTFQLKLGTSIGNFCELNGMLLFTMNAFNGIELWRSNGTVAGTQIVRDINPGGGNSSIQGL